jgi:UPF0716 protein FxsA
MVSRLLLIYAVVELAVVFALASTIGFGWTLLVLLATFLLGCGVLAPLGGWQLTQQFVRLRSGSREPQSALSDGALVAIASGLVIVPGLVTTALGLLLLMPPIRAVARPGLTAIALRGFLRRVPLTADTRASDAGAWKFRPTWQDRRDDRRDGTDVPDYIDGEVIDVRYDRESDSWEPPTLPPARTRTRHT